MLPPRAWTRRDAASLFDLVSMRRRRAGEVGNRGSDRRSYERMLRLDPCRAGGCYRICRDGPEELRGSALEGSESRSLVFGVPYADALVSRLAALKTS
jgi:hypothetical protein